MKKLLKVLTTIFLLYVGSVSAQGFSCASDFAELSAKVNYPNYTRDRENSLLFADHFRNSFAARMINMGCQRTAIKYRIPIAFHVVNVGEPVGTGSNIADTQIINSVARMNVYWAPNGVEFVLAKQDQYGNAFSGIDRVNGTVVPNYASNGIDIRSNPIGASDTAIKNLKRLPWQFCINIWVVKGFTTGGAYSNMPSGYEFQGIVISYGGIAAQTALSHEMGHYMGLYHTFNGSFGSNCADNSDPYHMGDYCADTPPLLQSDCGGTSSCGLFSNIINSWKNIMGYCPGQYLFTADQKLLVMAALFGEFRWGLVSSAALNPVDVPLEISVDSIAFVQNTSAPICNGELTTKAQFGNFSSNSVDSIKIHFKLGSLDTIYTALTNGSFLRGSNNWLLLPTVKFTTSGSYTAEVEFLKVNNQDDYNLMNNNQCISVDVIVQSAVITTTMNNPSAGTISGAGIFSCNGITDTIRVVTNPGFVFQSIKEGNTVVSISPVFPLSIDLSRGNRTFTAYHTVQTFTVSATANPSNGGTVTGAGTYNYGSNVTLKFSSKPGFQLTSVTENGNFFSADSTINLLSLNASRNFVGNFTLKTFPVTVSIAPAEAGIVTGAGTYNYGTNVTTSVALQSCYELISVTDNGNTVTTNTAYSSLLYGAKNIVFTARKKQFNVTATVNNASYGTVSGGGNVDCGGNITLYAHTINGGKFLYWKENNIIISSDSTLPLSSVSGNRNPQAFFEQAVLQKVSAGPDQSICSGASATLTATNSTSYLWSNNVNGSSITVSPTTTTTYIVTGLNGTKDTVVVTVKALPNVLFNAVVEGSKVQFNLSAPDNNASYNWNFGDAESSQSQNPLHTYTSSGKKYVVLQAVLNGCSAQKTDSVVIGNIATGISNNNAQVDVKIYPNPTSDFINVQFGSYDHDMSMQIVNDVGQTVWTALSVQKQQTINVQDFAKGTYILILDDGKSITNKRFVVQ